MTTKLTDEQLLQELERRFSENKRSLKEMKKLTEQLKAVNKKLGESEAMKTHFISNITNEIINPFASILGLSRNILAVKKENWDKVRSMVELIHSEAFNLDFQLKNIFVAAKLEGGEIYPEVMNSDIQLILNSVVDSFRHEAGKKNIDIEVLFELSPKVEKTFYYRTDPEKLKVVLANLISNAVKFSHEGDNIRVKAWIDKEELKISVEDSGIGISKKNQQIIFDRFSRIDDSINSINRGHGLGLSVSKALLDLLGGEIDIKSKEKEGSHFTISLPEQSEAEGVEGYASDANEFFFDDEEGGDEEIF